MALAYTEVRGSRAELGQYRKRVFVITLDTDYPTAGWFINPQNVGLDSVFCAAFVGTADGTAITTSYDYQYNVLTGKLQAFASGANAGDGLAEAASGLDALSGRKVVFEFSGY